MSSLDRVFYSLRSPFARRVRLAYARLGVAYEGVVEDVFKPSDAFIQANALGQVPVLVSKFGTLADSAAILEHLHEEHGQRIWPSSREERYAVRAASVLAEGLMTYSVNHFLKFDPEECLLVIERALTRLCELLPLLVANGEPTQAGWDLAVALEYIELRQPFYGWRTRHPALEPVHAACAKHPEWRKTSPPPA